MILQLAILAAGMVLLVLGGRMLVSGASQLARGLGVSELTVALTVVAFGTSAPELSVNVLAALQGSSALAFGNVVGSNITNVALVLGVCALIRPLAVGENVLSKEIPLMLLATVLTVALGLDLHRPEGGVFARNDGFVLLVIFAVFLTRAVAGVLWQQEREPLDMLAHTLGVRARPASAWPGAVRVAVGLAGLIAGGQLTVDSAVALAEALEVPRAVIGLTVVAFGTSLPELATSIVAAARGQTDLAVGNVVGSNIFNLLFILGATASIRPVEVPTAGGTTDLLLMTVVSVAILVFARLSRGRIVRWQGALLVTTYLAFVGLRYTI